MKKNLYFASVAIVCGLAMSFTSCSKSDNPVEPTKTVTVSDFESTGVTFNEKGYWNGGAVGTPEEGDWGDLVYKNTAISGKATIHVTYNTMSGFDWWSGIALSQSASTEFVDLDSQYNNIVGGGADGSKTFAVVYGDLASLDVNVEGGAEVSSIAIANSAYTMQNVLVGDGYSPKFSKEGDHIYVNITATKNDGTEAVKTVKLAEFTTELSYIKGWEVVDLKELGKDVTKLTFTFDASNSGIPQYFCFDNLVITEN